MHRNVVVKCPPDWNGQPKTTQTKTAQTETAQTEMARLKSPVQEKCVNTLGANVHRSV